jgi:rhamnogalacturonan acetylesterase
MSQIRWRPAAAWLALGLVAATCVAASVAEGQESQQRRRSQGRGRTNRAAIEHPLTERDSQPWSPTDFDKADPKLPTLFIASDSTAATGNHVTRGWGAVLIDYFDPTKVNIVNRAVGGRSFRTYTAEGRWQEIVEHLKPGDFVIIELGHNDGGGAKSPTGRGDVPGVGDETETVERRDGTSEVVHSYGWYARTYVRQAREKGATPILSTTTVRNIWKGGGVERGMGQMLHWLKQVADEEQCLFLDHANITADVYEDLGPEAVAKLFPQDHTHTSTDGAIANAETLVAGLKTLEGEPLVGFLNAKGQAIAAHPRGAKWKGYGEYGARLGIASADGAGAATVGAIQPGTPAAEAGLQVGDVITEVGGVATADFTALTQAIAKLKLGERVPFKLLRSGKPLEVMVTFNERTERSEQSSGASENQRRDAPFGLDRRGRPLRFPPGVEPGMPHPDYNPEIPTLWLIGDSTVKEGRDTGLNGGRWGWGHEIGRYFDLTRINVENQALGGTSSRSFRTGGWWESVLEMIKPGDFVMIQFGHNDGGIHSRQLKLRARGTLPGAGDETAQGSNDKGEPETVHTYGWYIRQYAADVRAAGAIPIVCSPIPRNTWRDGRVVRGQDGSYVAWAREAAELEGVAFINLNHLICETMDAMGEDFARVALFRADDATHTNLLGAQVNAHCVVRGVKSLGDRVGLAPFLSPVAQSVSDGR